LVNQLPGLPVDQLKLAHLPSVIRDDKRGWIPAFAGMTERIAGMTEVKLRLPNPDKSGFAMIKNVSPPP